MKAMKKLLLKTQRLLPMASLSAVILCAACLIDAAANSDGRRTAYRSQNHLIYAPPPRPPDIFDDATCTRREIGGHRRRPSRLRHLSSILRGGGGNIDDDSDCNEENSSCSEEEQENEPSNENESADGNIEDDENSTIIRNPPLRQHHLDKKYSLKRGTRTTGAGASRRNPSIFSFAAKNNEGENASLSSSRWTASALAGDVLNRHQKDAENENDGAILNSNSMLGRLWVRQSERGSLVFKFPRGRADVDDGGDDGEDIFVELSESSTRKESEDKNGTARLLQSTIHARYIDLPTKQFALAAFIPIEGIYGVYNLPCSGPHAVLITESEEVYTSPPVPSCADVEHDEGGFACPLLELRRIKSLEIVSLRPKTGEQIGNSQDGLAQNKEDDTPSNPSASLAYSEEQLAEESRQLRLLRRSFREHDLYFTVPQRSSNDGVVRDATHSLQRSFVEWAAHRRQRGEYSENSDDTDGGWWTPYIEKEQPTADRQQQRNSRLVDTRFFWNEQPALSLLPPTGSEENMREQLQSAHALILDHVIPVTSAFVGVRQNVPIPSTTSPTAAGTGSEEKYDQILISRRSKYRTGTRFTRRGADDTGAVANYAETEQICFVTRDDNPGDDRESGRELLEVYSHVQTRGSIPLHWSSPAKVKEYRPRVYIGVDPMVQARGLRDHLLGELWLYSSPTASVAGEEDNSSVLLRPPKRRRVVSVDKESTETKLAMVNLIDKHGDQGRLGKAFDSVLSAVLDVYGSSSPQKKRQKEQQQKILLHPGSVEHIWYDFHAECKGGRWDRLSELLDSVVPALEGQGYLCAAPTTEPTSSSDNDPSWEIQSLQDGVVRTNCMDCLDRTNVVQSMFGRYILYRQLHERLGRSRSRKRNLPLECVVGYKQRPLTLPWIEGEDAHRYLWADNADAISRLYAGTPALKGDFTRTGTRTRRGALDDGVNSLQRYYLNNFIDADRQEGMDLLVGSVEFNSNIVLANNGEDDDASDEMSRLFMMQELATRSNRRRGYDETHARIKVEEGQSFFVGNGGGGEEMRKLSLNWLPGDLRHHMRSEALRSCSPLSSAADEEDIDAASSSDFLLRVTSSAARDEVPSTLGDVDGIQAMQSIDRRVSSWKPWWAISDEEDDDEDDNDELVKHRGGHNIISNHQISLQLRARNALGFAKKRAVAVSLILLTKAPILSAAFVVAIIASGFSSQPFDEGD